MTSPLSSAWEGQREGVSDTTLVFDLIRERRFGAREVGEEARSVPVSECSNVARADTVARCRNPPRPRPARRSPREFRTSGASERASSVASYFQRLEDPIRSPASARLGRAEGCAARMYMVTRQGAGIYERKLSRAAHEVPARRRRAHRTPTEGTPAARHAQPSIRERRNCPGSQGCSG